jgi:hypothetical protein
VPYSNPLAVIAIVELDTFPARSADAEVMLVASPEVTVDVPVALAVLLGSKFTPEAFNTKIRIAPVRATILVAISRFLFVCLGIYLYFYAYTYSI